MTPTNPQEPNGQDIRSGWRLQALALWAVVAVLTVVGGTVVEDAGLRSAPITDPGVGSPR